MQGEWRLVVGQEEFFEVSNTGLVRRRADGTIVKQTETYDGYSDISLCFRGAQRIARVHRLVAEAFLSTWDPHLEVNHIDGNKKNNCVTNLEMVTHQQNMDHYWRSEVFAEHQQQYLEYARAAMTARWKDPEFRAKVQAKFDDPEYKKAHSESGKRVYDDPEQRAAASLRSKEMWATEGFHDKQISVIKSAWTSDMRQAAKERMAGMTWMSTPEGKNVRIHCSQVDAMLHQGYKLGRVAYRSSKCQKVYCKKFDKVFDSFSDCDRMLGLKLGDTYAILKGHLPKRLVAFQNEYQLSIYKENI